MSRTKHHKNQKHQHDAESLWSRRADMGTGSSYSSFNKKLTISKERAAKQKDITNEIKHY